MLFKEDGQATDLKGKTDQTGTFVPFLMFRLNMLASARSQPLLQCSQHSEAGCPHIDILCNGYLIPFDRPSADRHAESVSWPYEEVGYPGLTASVKRAFGSSNLQARVYSPHLNWQARQWRQSARPAGVTGHPLPIFSNSSCTVPSVASYRAPCAALAQVKNSDASLP